MYQFSKATPESQGIYSQQIFDLAADLNSLNSVHSFAVSKNDHIIAEAYWYPFSSELRHEVFSVSKSFLSLAFGIAAGEGKIGFDDLLVDFFPEKLSSAVSSRMRKVTMRHLLTMSSGHEKCPAMDIATKTKDWIKGFLESELIYEPGTTFVYNSANSYMISAVLQKVLGSTVFDYLDEKLLQHIGIKNAKWDKCPAGINFGGWGMWLTTSDLMRFARLLLNGGKWDGVELVPEEYFKAATSAQIEVVGDESPDYQCGYGYHFWMSRHNGFRAAGACGQYVLIYPEQSMYIVITSGMSNMRCLLDAVENSIFKVPSSGSLNDDINEQNRLSEYLTALNHPPIKSELRFVFDNAEYYIDKNTVGLEQLKINFDDKGCELTFGWNDYSEKLRADYGAYCFNDLILREFERRRLAASAAWRSKNTLEIRVYGVETPYRDDYWLEFSENTIQLRRESNLDFLHFQLPVFHGVKNQL